MCAPSTLGSRGYGPNRASGYWTHGKQYTAQSNDRILLICQIETAGAVAEIDEICQIDGIDAVWIGPTDLAQSLGHLGDAEHPEMKKAINAIIEGAKRHDMPWGIPTKDLDTYEKYVQNGGTVMILGSDTRILREAGLEFVRGAAKQGRPDENA